MIKIHPHLKIPILVFPAYLIKYHNRERKQHDHQNPQPRLELLKSHLQQLQKVGVVKQDNGTVVAPTPARRALEILENIDTHLLARCYRLALKWLLIMVTHIHSAQDRVLLFKYFNAINHLQSPTYIPRYLEKYAQISTHATATSIDNPAKSEKRYKGY